MTQTEIFAGIKKIFLDNFIVDEASITPQTTMNQIPQWSSLTHLFLVDGIESRFNISFSPSDIEKATSIDSIIAIIEKKIK